MKKFFLAVVILATGAVAGFSAAVEPVPPCPYQINIEKPVPGTPDNLSSLLGEWTGTSEVNSITFRNIQMIIYKMDGKNAWLYYGFSKAADARLVRDASPGWLSVKADIVIKDNGEIHLEWTRLDDSRRINFVLKDGKLVRNDSTWSRTYGNNWFTTTLTRK
jgi:hypothetical protein